MEYIHITEASKVLDISSRQLQKLCKDGKIPGAKRDNRNRWLIPTDWIKNSDFAKTKTVKSRSCKTPPIEPDKKRPLPIGVSNFKKAVTEYYYIDKTLLIKELLDIRPQVVLFTRPRRFGKTLNMDMLRTFFEKDTEDTSIYFQDKKIWAYGTEYQHYQGKYPVIFLTFKDTKFAGWLETFSQIKAIIRAEFARHKELKECDELTEYERSYYQDIVLGTAEDVLWTNALAMLSKMLDTAYGIAPIIIIDEYDTPIQEGYVCGYYDEVISFMRNFFSGGLKDNRHLSFAFMTGILRVAKESIFSGMNNLKLYSIMDSKFSDYFGFTEAEVEEMSVYYDCKDKITEIKEWYNGYLFGESEIFNPWSVINYFADGCKPKAFWQSTGSNDIIGEIISEATPEILENLESLIEGKSVLTYIDTGVIYPEIRKNPSSVFSFLLVAGYLKYDKTDSLENGSFMCQVAIPNKEISFVYEKEVLSRFEELLTPAFAVSIQKALYMADAKLLAKELNQFMLRSVSFFDTSNESFYHGMMLGLCAVMNNRYHITSNRESGKGRFDIQLRPKNHKLPGVVMELKVAHAQCTEEDMTKLSKEALNQIKNKQYCTELLDYGCSNILLFGIAFYGKTAMITLDVKEK